MRAIVILLVIGAALAAPEERKTDPVRIPPVVDLKNARCPVSGEPAGKESHVDWNGVRVHLCCADCEAVFGKDPAAALGKLGLSVVKDDAGKTVVDLGNATCPIMEKPSKAEVFGDVDGVRVHYCCEGCDKKVRKEPGKAFAAMGYGYIPAVVDLRNKECPVSGEPADEATFADRDGVRVRFCCGDCVKAFESDPAAVFAKLGVDPRQVKEATK